jgi:glutamate/aspartate transport system permease protein
MTASLSKAVDARALVIFNLSLSGLWSAAPLLLQGLKVTLLLFAFSAIIGLVFGGLLAIIRIYGARPIAAVATWYVNIFRALPSILLIFWMFLVMPYVLRFTTGDPYATGSAFEVAVFALALAQSAYFCEVVRAGFASVPVGQGDAALALGMSRLEAIWLVTLPQALRNMMPSLINQLIALFKDTSLVYVIGLHDFLGVASMIGQRDNLLIEFYLIAAVIYLSVCSAGVALLRIMNRRKSNNGKHS